MVADAPYFRSQCVKSKLSHSVARFTNSRPVLLTQNDSSLTIDHIPTKRPALKPVLSLVRVERVELSFLPWEGSIIAVIRYPLVANYRGQELLYQRSAKVIKC